METDEYRRLNFFRVLEGGVTCLHRPSVGGITKLAQLTPCTTVFTLQSKSECPHEVEKECKKNKLEWYWINLPGANKRLLESNQVAWNLKKGLLEAKRRLKQGEFLFVHCAAGIHRTGLFIYALLRICGLDQETTLEAVKSIRQVTYERCGKHRFELAEGVAGHILEKEVVKTIKGLEGLSPINYIEEPLVWMKLTPTHQEAIRLECIITDPSLTNYILGPSFNVKLKFKDLSFVVGEQWMQFKDVEFLPGGRNCPLQKAEKELGEFLAMSIPRNSGILAGKFPSLELEFIRNAFPKAFEYFNGDVIDLSEHLEENTLISNILFYRSNYLSL